MIGRSGCRVLVGCESGRNGKACDCLLTGVACDGVLLLSGREGTDDGCIGGPALTVDLTALVSCCDGVDELPSGLDPDVTDSLSREDGAGATGVGVLRFDPSSISRAGVVWVPFLRDAD
jgi:hypothetical protein